MSTAGGSGDAPEPLSAERVQRALELYAAQLDRLRVLLAVYCVGTGTIFATIAVLYVALAEHLRDGPAVESAPWWGRAAAFALCGLALIVAGFRPRLRLPAIVAGAALTCWQAAAYGARPHSGEESSPAIALLFASLAFYLLLGVLFARAERIADQAAGRG